MTPDNFRRALRAFTRRQPFRQFVIEFNSGDRLSIVHPECVSLRGEIAYFISPHFQTRLFDSTSVCQLLDLEPHSTA